MTKLTQRRVLDFAIFMMACFILDFAGAGLVAPAVLLPFSIWNYYDGKTRGAL